MKIWVDVFYARIGVVKMKKMIKLLFVIDSLNSGGAEKSLVNLLNEIDYSKYEVSLQLFSNRNFLLDLVSNEVTVLPLPQYFEICGKSWSQLIREKKFLGSYYRLKTSFLMRGSNRKKRHILQIQWKSICSYIEKNQETYDVAIAYGQGMPTYYVMEKIEANKKIAWVNCLYSNTRYNKKEDYEYYRKYDAINVVSEESKKDYLSTFPNMKEKVNVIYDFISPKSVCRLSNEPFDWNDGFTGIRITSILRMEWVKGPDIILECCKKLKESNILFKWYLIGAGGNLLHEIEDTIVKYELQDNLVLLGPQLNPFKYVKNSNIYVQSSRIEGYCMALAEAKLLDVGIVSTNFLLVKEHIQDGVNGSICEMNAEDMFEKVQYMIQNKDFRMKTIENRKTMFKDYQKEFEKFIRLISR